MSIYLSFTEVKGKNEVPEKVILECWVERNKTEDVTAVIDPDDVLMESNEDNNQAVYQPSIGEVLVVLNPADADSIQLFDSS